MKLAALNPFLPRDPKAQAEFVDAYRKEMRIYRRKPLFVCSLMVALLGALWLITRLDTLERLILLPIVAGLALAHDAITSHFVKRIIEIRKAKE